MGNYRFRLSDMMPNAWFYKLKAMGTARNHENHTNTLSSIKTKQDNASTTTSSVSLSTSTTTTTTTTQQQPKPNQPHHHHSYPRKSYYIHRDLIPSCESRFHNSPTTNQKVSDTSSYLPDPPRKSSKQKHGRRPNRNSPNKLVSSSVSAGCSCRATIRPKSDSPLESSPSPLSAISSDEQELQFAKPPPTVPKFRPDRVLPTNKTFDDMVSWSTSFGCEKHSKLNTKDIIIDAGDKFSVTKSNNLDGFDQISNLDLPPIITKPSKLTEATTKCRRSSVSISVKEQKKSPVIRRLSTATSPGVRLRLNSPRLVNKKIQGRKSVSSNSSSRSRSRRSLSDSLAIVKSSFNPQKDFRDSMVEMIMENNIKASKDLEELLACYLSLNSDEYHDLIIKVFKQIWFDLTDIPVK